MEIIKEIYSTSIYKITHKKKIQLHQTINQKNIITAMPTIALTIQKGGSGKTTTAINLAAALQILGKKVLLVDMDPQANLTHSLGITDEPEPSIYHMLKDEGDGGEADLKSIISAPSGIPIVPASIELAGAELELVRIYGREHLLKRMLEPLTKDYDFILIDCPPSIGMLTVNALVASDYVLLPMQAEFLHYKGLKSFMHHFKKLRKSLKPELEILGIVITKYDHRKNMHRDTYERLKKEYDDKLFDTTIRSNIDLAKAQEKGKDIFQFSNRCNGAADYMAMAEEMIQKLIFKDADMALPSSVEN